jgi:hypothetical protein
MLNTQTNRGDEDEEDEELRRANEASKVGLSPQDIISEDDTDPEPEVLEEGYDEWLRNLHRGPEREGEQGLESLDPLERAGYVDQLIIRSSRLPRSATRGEGAVAAAVSVGPGPEAETAFNLGGTARARAPVSRLPIVRPSLRINVETEREDPSPIETIPPRRA